MIRLNNPLLRASAFGIAGFYSIQNAMATTSPFQWSDTATEGFTTTGAEVGKVVKFAFFILYMLGGTFMAASGFKLSQGDIPGFLKMCGGGVFLFLTPKLIKELAALGGSA